MVGVAAVGRQRAAESLPKCADRGPQLGGGLVRDVLQSPRFACHFDQKLGIHHLDQNHIAFATGVGPHHHVAR